MNIAEAKKADLVDYLAKLGHHPSGVHKNDYWYLSPLRNEKTASFKIDRKQQVWFDHGIGKGGNIIDFVKLYYNCTVKEVLEKLKGTEITPTLPFHQPKITESKINIISSEPITDQTLKNYLAGRKIPLEIASHYCSEVEFEIGNKKHKAIGFQNDNGGYDLRNYYFKGSSTPKEPRIIARKEQTQEPKELKVFEGFFDFLSEMAKQYIRDHNIVHIPEPKNDALILNSLSFFEQMKQEMDKYICVRLHLDNDKAGREATAKALTWSDKYIDHSKEYKQYKDINEALIKSETKQQHKKGLRP